MTSGTLALIITINHNHLYSDLIINHRFQNFIHQSKPLTKIKLNSIIDHWINHCNSLIINALQQYMDEFPQDFLGLPLKKSFEKFEKTCLNILVRITGNVTYWILWWISIVKDMRDRSYCWNCRILLEGSLDERIDQSYEESLEESLQLFLNESFEIF